MSEPKLSLLDIGSRWEHYSELREVFACGVEILRAVKPVYQSSSDKEKLLKLEHAIELIDRRIELFADFNFKTTYGSKLRTEIDGDVDNLFRKMKRENGNDNSPRAETNPST